MTPRYLVWIIAAAAVASVLLSTVASLAYTSRVQHQLRVEQLENDRQWCDVYAVLLRDPTAEPPGLPANSILRRALTRPAQHAQCTKENAP